MEGSGRVFVKRLTNTQIDRIWYIAGIVIAGLVLWMFGTTTLTYIADIDADRARVGSGLVTGKLTIVFLLLFFDTLYLLVNIVLLIKSFLKR